MLEDPLQSKAKQIKCAIFDVDGVFTNGLLYYTDQGVEIKAFHVHDGLGVKLLQKHGILVAVISSRESPLVSKRMQELGIQYLYQGYADKMIAFEHLLSEHPINPNQIAYMGDDLPDIPVMQRVGFSITVPNANHAVQKIADWKTTALGGHGAVREACEYILQAQQTSLNNLC